MKTCNTCCKQLPFSEFWKHSETKDGYRNSCKSCKRLSDESYRKENPDKLSQYERKKYLKNIIDPTFRAKKLSRSNKRRASKLNATPSWLSKEQIQEIDELYEIAKIFKIYTGLSYHVDHIVPLNNKLVCGLHVPWNLQILEEKDNLKKNNRLD